MSLRGHLKTIGRFLRAGTRVAVERRKRGPLRPNWTWTYETTVLTARRNFSKVAPPAKRRAWFDNVGRLAPQMPGLLRRRVTLGGREAEWQIPAGADENGPVLLYLHGGGYTIGSYLSHRALTERLAHLSGLRVVSLNYRLAPEHPCPAGLHDALAAVRELRAQGITRLIVAGDSAGGGLSLATAMALRDAGEPQPDALVLLSPWADLTERKGANDADYLDDKLWEHQALPYAAELELTDWRVSPLLGDFAGLAPTYVLAGGAEILLGQSERVAERARQAGVPVVLDVEPDEIHVFPIFGQINPRAAAALRRIADWVHDTV